MPAPSCRVLSWNINGIRAAEKKGFSRWLSRCKAEVVALQEVRALPDDCTMEDIQFHLYVKQKVARGIQAIDESRLVPLAKNCRLFKAESRRTRAEGLIGSCPMLDSSRHTSSGLRSSR